MTEGTKTEPQYVERLNSYLRSRASTAVVKSVGVGQDPLHVVQKCVELRDIAASREKPYDVCVCLVDVDDHSKLNDAATLAGKESVLLLISNLKFEVWLRWHAEAKRSAMTSAQLDEHVEKLNLVQDKALSLQFPFDCVDDACHRARQADPDLRAGRKGPDPSSALPILIDLMRGAA